LAESRLKNKEYEFESKNSEKTEHTFRYP